MKSIYVQYSELNIDGELICLKQQDNIEPYFCYPINAIPIGFEGCIMYCFIDGYGEMVFASNPISCNDKNVYPLAYNFEDFLRLILTCGSANPVEQICSSSKESFELHVMEEIKNQTVEQKELVDYLGAYFNLEPMESPHEYVTEIQLNFDNSKIVYGDEYYKALGISIGDNRSSSYEFRVYIE